MNSGQKVLLQIFCKILKAKSVHQMGMVQIKIPEQQGRYKLSEQWPPGQQDNSAFFRYDNWRLVTLVVFHAAVYPEFYRSHSISDKFDVCKPVLAQYRLVAFRSFCGLS